MAHVHVKMHSHVGFAVVDRVPVERYSETEKIVGGYLASLGKWWPRSGMVPSCMMSKIPANPSGMVCGARSQSGAAFSYRWRMVMDAPVCHWSVLSPGCTGRTGRLVSLCTVHNELRRCHPDLLARLYRPFWWDRQAEHAPDDVCVSRHPVYQYDGHTLMARYYDDYMCHGARLGEALDTAGTAALAAMRAILDAPENWVEFRVEQGQLQYINNRQFAHARTAFGETSGVRSPRHMLRLWNRNEGTPDLEGQVDTV